MKLTIFSNKTIRVINLTPAFFSDDTKLVRGKRVITTPIDKARTLSRDLVLNDRLDHFVLENDDKVIYDSSKENRDVRRSVSRDSRGAGKAWHKTHMASNPQPRKHKLNFRGPYES